MEMNTVGGNPELPPSSGGRYRPLVGLLIVGALGVPLFLLTRGSCPTTARCHCKYARARAAAEPPAWKPASTWEVRCRARLEGMANEMVAYSHFTHGVKVPDVGHIEVKTGGPQGDGLWFHINGPHGETYAAGVSGVQQGEIPDADWYSLNAPSEPLDRMSFFRDYGKRGGFYAAIDSNSDGLDWFGMHARAALDGCLELDAQ